MNEEVKLLKEVAEQSRILYNCGHISREEAKEQILPYIDKVNERSRELAKKYNQKPKLVSFGAFVR